MNIIERLESYMIEEEDHPDLIYLKHLQHHAACKRDRIIINLII